MRRTTENRFTAISLFGGQTRRKRQSPRASRLRAEYLEQRNLLTTLTVTSGADSGPGTFRDAIDAANSDPSVNTIQIDSSVGSVSLDTAVEYTGGQTLGIDGNGATVEASTMGANDLLVSSGGASLNLANLTFQDGANGILVPVPADASGVVHVSLNSVDVLNNGNFGLYIDDQSNDSNASVHLDISNSSFTNNGTADTDFDGARVDEGGNGNIVANVVNSQFDGNGGDGFELDEKGPGDISFDVSSSTFNENGFFDADDLEDGVDIDEAGPGSFTARIVDALFNGNADQGLDLDEEFSGNVNVSLLNVVANENAGEGIKIDEKFDDDDLSSDGNLVVSLVNVEASGSGEEEGIAITEEGNGHLSAILQNVVADGNDKEGIDISEEGSGNLSVNLRDVSADGNDDDGIQLGEEDGGNLAVVAVRVTSTNNDRFGLKVEQDDAGKGSLILRDATLEDNGDGDVDTDGVVVKLV